MQLNASLYCPNSSRQLALVLYAAVLSGLISNALSEQSMASSYLPSECRDAPLA